MIGETQKDCYFVFKGKVGVYVYMGDLVNYAVNKNSHDY